MGIRLRCTCGGPGVNNLGKYGRWAFAEFTAVFEIESEFRELIDSLMLEPAK
jgi:type III restriction enzyme